jgi:hypothetical protein
MMLDIALLSGFVFTTLVVLLIPVLISLKSITTISNNLQTMGLVIIKTKDILNYEEITDALT